MSNEEALIGTDPTNADSDNDGFSDGEELDMGTDPTATRRGLIWVAGRWMLVQTTSLRLATIRAKSPPTLSWLTSLVTRSVFTIFVITGAAGVQPTGEGPVKAKPPSWKLVSELKDDGLMIVTFSRT